MRYFLTQLLTFIVTLLISAPAFAGYFTVCGYAYHWEDRQDVPISTSTYGSFLQDDRDTNQRYGAGVRVELWDQDGDCPDFACSEPEGDDDLLDYDYTDSNGYYCFQNIGDLEDIYVVTTFKSFWGEIRVPTATGSTGVKIGTYPALINFGNGGSGFFAKSINTTCWDNTKNSSSALCDNDNDVETYFNDQESYSNILAVLVDLDTRLTSATLGINSHYDLYTAYWPDGDDDQCDDAGGSTSWGFAEFCMENGDELENHAVAHEVGHNLHRRALDYSGSLADGSCYGPHSWTSNEYNKCATSEGWASFFAGAIYFYPYATDPFYGSSAQHLEGDTAAGNQYADECVSFHPVPPNPAAPHRREGNVARFFWDLYDSTNEDESGSGSCTGGCDSCGGGYDNISYSLADIVDEWAEFADGTGDAENDEAGDNGRNVWDYYTHYNNACANIHLNCLADQEEPD